jgi:hypothetical protein
MKYFGIGILLFLPVFGDIVDEVAAADNEVHVIDAWRFSEHGVVATIRACLARRPGAGVDRHRRVHRFRIYGDSAALR